MFINVNTKEKIKMYLEHHGILGMHWGIRRYQNKDGSLTAEGIKRYRTDLKFKSKYDRQQAKREAKRANEVKTKSIKELSDEELRERIQRLELEKRVIDLERAINGGNQGQNNNNNQNQSNKDKAVQQSVSFGKKFVGEIGKSVTKMAVGYASKKIFDAITGGLDKSSKKEAAKAVKETKDDITKSVEEAAADWESSFKPKYGKSKTAQSSVDWRSDDEKRSDKRRDIANEWATSTTKLNESGAQKNTYFSLDNDSSSAGARDWVDKSMRYWSVTPSGDTYKDVEAYSYGKDFVDKYFT